MRAAVVVSVWLLGWASQLAAQEPERWTVSPEPEVVIGKTTGEDAYLFQSIESAHFLPDDRIMVVDAGQDLIRIFDRKGEFRLEIGGPGQGPGEFENIMGTWLTSEGNVAVWDAAHRRISRLGLDGEVVSANRVRPGGNTPLASGNLEVFLGSFSDDDALLASLRVGGPPGTRQVHPDSWRLGRFELDGELRRRTGELRGMRRAGRRPVPFTPMPHVAVESDSIYVVDGYEAEITVMDERGTRVRRIQLPPLRVSSPDDVWASLEAEVRQRAARSSQLHLENLEQERVPRTDEFPQIADLLFDDRGYMWVKVYELPDDSIWLTGKHALWPASGGEWRVLRRNGEVVATVEMPEDVTPLEIRGDRILGVATNDLGVESVVVHTLERS